MVNLSDNKNDKYVSKINDALLINSGKLNDLIHNENLGILPPEEKKVARAEINKAVLYIVEQLPDNVFKKEIITKNNKPILFTIIAVVVLIVAYFVAKPYLTTEQITKETDTSVIANDIKNDTLQNISEKQENITTKDTTNTQKRNIEIENETKPIPEKKLAIDVWTDKGKKPEYTEGEIVSIYFKATKPCYIRLIYIMKDGSAVLLADNYKVDATSVNKELEARTKFGVGAPFGNEQLRAYAQTEPFDKLQTKKAGKYDIITQPLEEAYEITERGLYKMVSFVKTELPFITKPKE